MNINDWYWIVGNAANVYSSARNLYVPLDDAAYVEWSRLNRASAILNEAELWAVIVAQDASRFPVWLFDGEHFVPPADGVYSKAQLAAYAAQVRYGKEIGGVRVAGFLFPSDRDTQSKLTASALFAQVDPAQQFVWKLADGSFSPSLSAAEMISVAAAVGGYVNAAFGTEARLSAAIAAGSVTTREQIDAAFA